MSEQKSVWHWFSSNVTVDTVHIRPKMSASDEFRVVHASRGAKEVVGSAYRVIGTVIQYCKFQKCDFSHSCFFIFSRLLHVGELLPARRGSPCSAAAADAEWKWHALRPVQLLPVQSWRPQSGGLTGVRASQRRSSWQPSVERIRLSRKTVAPGWPGRQHLLAQRVPGTNYSHKQKHSSSAFILTSWHWYVPVNYLHLQCN